MKTEHKKKTFMNHIIDIPLSIIVIIAFLALIMLIIIVSLNVFYRYVLKSGLMWSEEIASFVLTPAFAFIGMAMGTIKDIHININVLPKKLPKIIELILDVIKWISILIIGIMLCYYGTLLIMFTSTSELAVTHLPASFQYIIMPISGAILITSSILALLPLFFKNR